MKPRSPFLAALNAALAPAILATTLLFASPTFAHGFTLGHITIGHPWARATAPGAQTGGAYLKLENQGAADRLVSASASVSEAVEVHSMSMQGDVMKMEKLDHGVALAAGKTVELAPGGLHIMLIGLKAPLKAGESFPLKLKFEKAGEITVDVKIESLTAGTTGAMPKH